MTNKKQKNIFHARIIQSGICGRINLKRYFLKIIVPTDELSSHRWIRLPQITRMNTDYYWTRISRISRIVPCGRHFHPSASNCCYCNRKSVKICAICGSINLKRYFLKNIIPTDEIVPTDELSSHGWIRLPQITRMNTDYFPCGGTRIILNTNKPNRTNFPSGSHFV